MQVQRIHNNIIHEKVNTRSTERLFILFLKLRFYFLFKRKDFEIFWFFILLGNLLDLLDKSIR